MIDQTPHGIAFSVRVIPRSGRSGVDGTRNDAVLIRVKAAPVEGAANNELIEIVASALDVPKRAIAIVSGAQGRNKRIHVDGVDVESARRALGLA